MVSKLVDVWLDDLLRGDVFRSHVVKVVKPENHLTFLPTVGLLCQCQTRQGLQSEKDPDLRSDHYFRQWCWYNLIMAITSSVVITRNGQKINPSTPIWCSDQCMAQALSTSLSKGPLYGYMPFSATTSYLGKRNVTLAYFGNLNYLHNWEDFPMILPICEVSSGVVIAWPYGIVEIISWHLHIIFVTCISCIIHDVRKILYTRIWYIHEIAYKRSFLAMTTWNWKHHTVFPVWRGHSVGKQTSARQLLLQWGSEQLLAGKKLDPNRVGSWIIIIRSW